MSWDDLRDDEPGETLPSEDVFANAPETHDAYFAVPSPGAPLPGVEDGKIVVMAPETAARAHEQATEAGLDDTARRVFAMAGLKPDVAYVIDLDALDVFGRKVDEAP